MDGLSGAASVIAVVDISAKIFASCQRYAKEVKDARKDIQRLRDGVTSLQDVLTDIADMEQESDDSKRTVFSRLTEHNGPVQHCEKELKSLLSELDVGENDKKMRKFGARALKWPFSSKDVEKRLAEIETLKTTFTLALTSDSLSFMRVINDNIRNLGTGIEELHLEQKTLGIGIEKLQLEQNTLATSSRQKEIRNWLAAPDPSSNHNAACKLHQKDTGSWLLESTAFQEWKTQPRSFLWLHGIPGSGKSILCSTIIEHIESQYHLNQAVVSAYYYFSFTNSDKQKHDKVMRSIIEQFAWKSAEALTCLESLYSQCEKGTRQPTEDELESTLRKMLKICGESFITIDALDECTSREDLLAFLGDFSSWEGKVHVLVTSRKERDIEQALISVVTNNISLEESEIENDIQSYITERLRKSSRLSRWPEKVKDNIDNTLTKKAQGMFRWVVCQMDVLEKCVSVTRMREALESLPQTLDETYDRILQNINKDELYRHDAFRIFQWLAYATRPLLLEELAEMLAVDTVKSKFDPGNRLADPQDLLTICSTLVSTVTIKLKGYSRRDGDTDYSKVDELSNIDSEELERYDFSEYDEARQNLIGEVTEVFLAHFSIKEYFTANRVGKNTDFQYDIRSTAQDEIARTCLTYLLYFQRPDQARSAILYGDPEPFPLQEYAGRHWCGHFRLAEESDSLNVLAMKLFEGSAFENWAPIYDGWAKWTWTSGTAWPKPIIRGSFQNIGPPIFYACAEGLTPLVLLLLEKQRDISLESADNNVEPTDAFWWYKAERDDRYPHMGLAFEAACKNGYLDIVNLLLDRRAGVGLMGLRMGDWAAKLKGQDDIQKLLKSAPRVVQSLAYASRALFPMRGYTQSKQEVRAFLPKYQ